MSECTCQKTKQPEPKHDPNVCEKCQARLSISRGELITRLENLKNVIYYQSNRSAYDYIDKIIKKIL